MSGESHVKAYVLVFVALVVGTALTVGASFMDLGHVGNQVVGMVIATAKALLVGMIFMHLKYEHRWIYAAALFPMALFVFFTMALLSDKALFRM